MILANVITKKTSFIAGMIVGAMIIAATNQICRNKNCSFK